MKWSGREDLDLSDRVGEKRNLFKLHKMTKSYLITLSLEHFVNPIVEIEGA